MSKDLKKGSSVKSDISPADGKPMLSAVLDKGEYDAECNRTACVSKNAKWFNHSTRKYYCRSCAEKINLYNRQDAYRLFGHDLCTFGKE